MYRKKRESGKFSREKEYDPNIFNFRIVLNKNIITRREKYPFSLEIIKMMSKEL